MNNTLTIRQEVPSDTPAITWVNDLAFDRPNEGQLVRKLRKLADFEPRLSLVCEHDSKIKGHILLFPIKIKGNNGNFQSLSLGPIAVVPDHQKQGIGGSLIREGHTAAVELGYNSVVLLGHPTYYPRFGYKPASLWNLTNPWGIHNEAFMAVELEKDALKEISGLAVYPDAFNDAA
jgi:predicted N-acetyltransferase YhbS